jgi:3'-phosphoadenosine 5'-phosphosulfate sulfotransferase (PAPS reductase)/FAD synthetase
MTKPLTIPTEVADFIAQDAVLAISISGGKDSQALLHAVMAWYRREGLTNHVFAIHADLGRAEWAQTPAFVESLCEQYAVELVVVRRTREGKEVDLVDGFERRMRQLEGQNKPHWSSARARYCTSDFKTQPINTYLKQFDKVISIEGIRWQESKARSLKPRVVKRNGMMRKALTWNAICDFTIEEVWATGGQTQASYLEAQRLYRLTNVVPAWWSFHPAYAMGNTRLSCALCILANANDFRNGIAHNPALASLLSKMETQSGFTFRQGKSIAEVRQEIEKKLTLF